MSTASFAAPTLLPIYDTIDWTRHARTLAALLAFALQSLAVAATLWLLLAAPAFIAGPVPGHAGHSPARVAQAR